MKLSQLFAFIIALTGTVVAQEAAPTPKKPTFDITSCKENSYPAPEGFYWPKDKKMFKLTFKMLDDSVSSLDRAAIYLYNDKKELVDTLVNVDEARHLASSTPNIITKLDELKKKTYNLIFPFEANILKYKYMIAVIATKEAVSIATNPTNLNVAEFDFKEKALIVK